MLGVLVANGRSLGLALILGALGAGCSDDDASAETPPPDVISREHRLTFSPVGVPDDEARKYIQASDTAWVGDQEVKLGYQLLQRSGQVQERGVFGRLVDHHGQPLKEADGVVERISTAADHTSLLPVGKKLFSLTHFEEIPAAIYLTTLESDAAGNLAASDTRPVDLSSVGGMWIPCAGSRTPWNTHFATEEFPPNAAATEDAARAKELDPEHNSGFVAGDLMMMSYFGLTDQSSMDEVRALYTPYRYGFATEIAVNEAGETRVTKHSAMGRHSLEVAYVMPDEKTAYLNVDGESEGFFLFVADAPRDLSAGTLYAMRWNQTSPDGAPHGTADIDWLSLGHATNAEVDAAIAARVTFSQLFERAALTETGCAEGFRAVNLGGAIECLRLQSGATEEDSARIRLWASRLESRRFAAYIGATTEMHKQEGLTFDAKSSTLYVAASRVISAMQPGNPSTDAFGPDHIRLATNDCGVVFGFDVAPDARIGSEYVATNARSVLEGVPFGRYPEDSRFWMNFCSVNGISEPDNLTFVPGFDTLIIAEDTSLHQSAAVWAYNVVTTKLTRIQTMPMAAEATAAYFYPNVNGHGYLMSVVQHPYAGLPEGGMTDPTGSLFRNAWVGYLGPFPAMDW